MGLFVFGRFLGLGMRRHLMRMPRYSIMRLVRFGFVRLVFLYRRMPLGEQGKQDQYRACRRQASNQEFTFPEEKFGGWDLSL